MRGRTALYGPRHVAQVVAIKRLQTMGRSLSEIQALWPSLDDPTLARMSGVALPPASVPGARAEFWKRAPVHGGAGANGGAAEHEADAVRTAAPEAPGSPGGAVELRIELAPQVVLSLAVVDDRVTVAPADVRAIRAAAAPLLAELASRRLASHPGGDE